MKLYREKEYTIIVGCGRLGSTLAGKLSSEKKDVLVIDVDKNSFRKLPRSYGGLTMLGSGTDLDKLLAANIQRASRVIAVTDEDNINICVAQIAKKMFSVEKVVARIYESEKSILLNDMDIDTICPCILSATVISNYIHEGVATNEK